MSQTLDSDSEQAQPSKREVFIKDTRELLDWLEKHPEIDEYMFSTYLAISVYPKTKDELAKLVRQAGDMKKIYGSSMFFMKKIFGQESINYVIERSQVCRKVVKGTRLIPEETRPAHEEEIVEWVCDDPILSENGPQS